MAKKSYGFSDIVKTYISRDFTKEDISKEIQDIAMKEVKAEINKTLQIANRRLQNIENSGVASPAYKALVNEFQNGKNKFSKLSIGGLDLTNKSQLTKAIDTYSKAISYLNNTTSTSSGAKKWVKNLATKNNIPFEVANNMVDLITNPQMTNGRVVINNWDSNRIGDMVNEFANQYDDMTTSKDEYYKNIQNEIQELIDSANKIADDVIDIFDL